MVEKSNAEAKPKRKRLDWSMTGELAVLDLWEERIEELRGLRKNGHIYAEMADDLSKLGYTHSARDVQVKLQNFTQRYRREKPAIGTFVGSSSTWVHYERVHQILEGFEPNLYNDVKLESIDDSSIASRTPPSTQLPSQITPLPPATPPPPLSSPTPGLSTSAAAEPSKRTRNKTFQCNLIEKFDELSSSIVEHLKKSEENEKELIEIERKKTEILEKIAKDNEEVKNALIHILKKH